VDVVEADHLKGWGILGPNLFPYVRLQVGESVAKTEVCVQKRKTPRWNERFVFEVDENIDPKLRVDIFNGQQSKQKIICSICLVFDKLAVEGRETDSWFDLRRKEKKAGRLHLRVKFILDNEFAATLATMPRCDDDFGVTGLEEDISRSDSIILEADGNNGHLWEISASQRIKFTDSINLAADPLGPRGGLVPDDLDSSIQDTEQQSESDFDESKDAGLDDSVDTGNVTLDTTLDSVAEETHDSSSVVEEESIQVALEALLAEPSGVVSRPTEPVATSVEVPISEDPKTPRKESIPDSHVTERPASPPIQSLSAQPSTAVESPVVLSSPAPAPMTPASLSDSQKGLRTPPSFSSPPSFSTPVALADGGKVMSIKERMASLGLSNNSSPPSPQRQFRKPLKSP